MAMPLVMSHVPVCHLADSYDKQFCNMAICVLKVESALEVWTGMQSLISLERGANIFRGMA